MGNCIKTLLAILFFFLAGCAGGEKLDPSCYTPEGCSPEAADTGGDTSPEDTNTGDTAETGDSGDTDPETGDSGDDSGDSGDSGGDTADTDITDELNCWYDTPFELKYLRVDRDAAELTPGNWDTLDWVDYDAIHHLDASANSVEVEVYTTCGRGYEGTMFVPDDFVMTDPRDELYNNGIVVALQPSGTVLEVNYFQQCDDGTVAGYLLPDDSPFNACGLGYDTTRYTGAHGGSHITGTQAIQPDELTNDVAITRPLPIEVDNTHLYCDPAITDGHQCFVGPLASSGDAEADEIYTGTIEGLTMGGILVLPEDFDCDEEMFTDPGRKLCEVGRDYFFFITDDSYGTDEVAFPMEASVPAEVEDVYGIELHNAAGDFAVDVQNIMQNILVVQNPEEAVY